MKKQKNLMQRTPGGNWTCRITRTVDGKPVEKWTTTGTPVLALARIKAAELRAAADAARDGGRWQDLALLNLRDSLPTFGELEERYRTRIERESVRAPGLHARGAYWRNLRGVVAWARGGSPGKAELEAVRGLSISVLAGAAGEEMVKAFRAAWLGQGTDPVGDARRRRSGDSMLRQARACFSGDALRCYAGLPLPDLSRFVKAPGFGAQVPQHREITGETLRAMADAAGELKGANPRLYAVHLMAKFTGLRNNELAAVRVGWFREVVWTDARPGQWVLELSERCEFVPKHFSYGQVPIKREVMSELVQAWRAQGISLDDPQAFAIPARHETERRDVVDREHAEFMRRFLPATEYRKAGYELRRWGQQRMSGKYHSREVGGAFVRHAAPADSGLFYQAQFFAWGELGDDIGISLEDARGNVATGATAKIRTGFAGL